MWPLILFVLSHAFPLLRTASAQITINPATCGLGQQYTTVNDSLSEAFDMAENAANTASADDSRTRGLLLSLLGRDPSLVDDMISKSANASMDHSCTTLTLCPRYLRRGGCLPSNPTRHHHLLRRLVPRATARRPMVGHELPLQPQDRDQCRGDQRPRSLQLRLKRQPRVRAATQRDRALRQGLWPPGGRGHHWKPEADDLAESVFGQL